MADNMRFERNVLRRSIKERLAQFRDRPMTIALIGTVGVGKSSFINTIACAMGKGAWREHAFTGHHGNRAEPVTAFTQRHPKCCRPDEHDSNTTPTLLDIGGLPDQLDAVWEEVIHLVLYGRVPDGTNLLDVYDYIVSRDRGDLHIPPRYWLTDPHLVVDRVVVVGASTEDIAENLLQLVLNAARPIQGPNDRSIPVFGVMTKLDLVDPEVDTNFKRREEVFKDILGLRGAGNRYLRCINYCSDIDPDNNRIRINYPSLDVPVLRLMTQICDPAIGVVNTDRGFPFWYLMKERSVQIFCFFVFLASILLLFSILLL